MFLLLPAQYLILHLGMLLLRLSQDTMQDKQSGYLASKEASQYNVCELKAMLIKSIACYIQSTPCF